MRPDRWIYHHYVSIVITLLILLYPDDFLHPDRHLRLMVFGLAQGAVMLCQVYYQSKRSYVRKTLGKAKSFDVDATETLVEKPTDLQWLVPILYALYFYEGYIGVEVLARFSREAGGLSAAWEGRPWHLVGIGLGCWVLAVGNFITTTLVLVSKQKLRKWTKMIRARKTPPLLAAAPQAGGSGEGKESHPPVDGKAEKAEKVEAKSVSPSSTAAEADEGADAETEGSKGEEETKKRKAIRRKK